MQIAPSISFRKAGKRARRITAVFTEVAQNLADIIAVEGTEDFRRINKDSKTWVSRCKYNSLEITLLYLDLNPNGLTVERATYDNDGNLISNVVEDAVIANIETSVDPETLNVTIKWQSTLEKKVRQYTCYRENPTDGEFVNFDAKSPTGTGSSYSALDQEEKERGSYNYYIYAQLESTNPQIELGKLVGTIEDVIV